MMRRLFSRKNRSTRSAARQAAGVARNRRLTLESLEDRRLLALTDLAAIEGTLFYKLPGNVDQPIPGEVVSLYQDANANGIFDDGTDPLRDTRLTDGNGYYRFEDLTTGTYFVVQPPEPSGNIHPAPVPTIVTIVITPSDAAGTAGILVDDFEEPQFLQAQLPPSGTPTVSGSVAAQGILGGHRQLIVNALLGAGNVTVVVDENNNGLFNYEESPNTSGNATAYWDGTAGDHLDINPTGLNGVDLTGNGAQDSFVLEIPFSDIPAFQTLTVYTDEDHASEAIIAVPFLAQSEFQRVKFSDFTAVDGKSPADFTRVGAIKFLLVKSDQFPGFGLDYQLRIITTVGPTVRRADLPFDVTSEIQLVKLTNGTDNDTPTGPLVPVGSTVTWTYQVRNLGNESIASVAVVDNQPGVNPAPILSGGFNVGDSNNNNLLEPSEVWLYTATGLAVAGQYQNLGTATGTGTVSGTLLTDTNPDHYFGAQPAIHIEKATNGQDADTPTGPLVAAGSTVTWTYAVTNPGNVPLSNVGVRDNNGTPSNPADDFSATFVNGDTNSNGLLEPGETWVYQATGIAVAGQYRNVATATGTDPIGQTATATDPSHYFGVDSAIDVEKATNAQDADTPTGPLVLSGSIVTWTYVVTNPGNVPLSNVVLRDDNGTPGNPLDDFSPAFVGGDVNANNLLDPGEAWVYQATGVAIVGQYGNLATATGTDPLGQTRTDTDPSHYFGVRSEIHVEKATNGQDADAPTGPLVAVGSSVIWSYAVTNPGNVPLSNVVLRDNNGTPLNLADDFSPAFLGGDTNNDGLLDPGETWLYQATGIAVAGQYANVATVNGTDPLGQTPNDTDPSHYFGVRSEIRVEKATNGQDADTPTGPLVAAGSTVTWTYVVTNPGNVPLASVVVRDDNGTPANLADDFNASFVGGDANNNGLLDPGETWVYQATGTAIVGQYGNVATASGVDPLGQTRTDTDPSHYFGVRSEIHVEKATNGQDADTPTGPLVAVGSTVTWTYVVTNPGNVPLANVTLRDDSGTPGNLADDFTPTFVGGDANSNGQLDPGESWQYQATGPAVAGQYANVATASGVDPLGQTRTDTDPSHYFGVRSEIRVEKATNGQDADTPTGPLVAVGSTVTWTYVVTNPGNVPLANVTLRDDSGTPGNLADDFTPLFVGGDANSNGQLDPGETWQYQATGPAVVGQYGNVATATGTDPLGQTRTDTDPSHYFGVRSEIRVEKATNGQDADTPTGPLVAVGSTVTWTYVVTNPGNVPLANVTLRDNNGTPGNLALKQA
jgi:hypothetical protein